MKFLFHSGKTKCLIMIWSWININNSRNARRYSNTVKTENKPRGLNFSKDFFEGLIFGRVLYSEGFIIGGKFAFQNWPGL